MTMSKFHKIGEAIPYPCGCVGEFERVPGQTKERLVVHVDPECEFDAKKVGQVLSWLRYTADPYEPVKTAAIPKNSMRYLWAGWYYAVRSLLEEVPEEVWLAGTTLDIRGLLVRIQDRQAIPGLCRMLQDRFAAFCGEARLSPEEREELRRRFFSSWVEWK
jgi:hypothetical protein